MRCKHCLLAFVCFFSSFCHGDNEPAPPSLPTLSPSEERFFQMVVDGNNRFGFDFYQTVKNQPGNLCFSPYSIASGLAMAASGAKGETAHELQRVLRYSLSLLPLIGDLNAQFSNASKTGSQVLLANALWIQKELPLLPSFKLTIEHEFRSTLQIIDFAKEAGRSVQTINQWVSQQTQRKINNLVNSQDVTSQTRLLLTTALYLKGAWAYPFDPKQTKRLPFTITPQRSFMANMMHTTSRYSLWKGEKWDLLEIPYLQGEEGGQLALAIFLPKNTPLGELEENFTWENWKQWLSQQQMQSVALSIPEFRIEQRFDLSNGLKAIGLSLPFTPQADFSGMTEKSHLFLNKALHKTFIKVDERGSEGAASPLSFNQKSAGEAEAPYEFKADHPFLFLIWDRKTNSILLMGRLAIP